ncbi:MAG: P1 family peptidase [Chloroflexota bacterium]|nr:P1 family peptidase [Chloroflexota bacterium]
MTLAERLPIRLGPGPLNAITDVPGIEVGHHTHERVLRGTTAVLCRGGAAAGVSVRGSNPGTTHTDALAATTAGSLVHGIGLTGGSLLGLSAVAGITEWLHGEGIGVAVFGGLIPIVPGAVILDYRLSDPAVLPTNEWGQKAAAAARGGRFARGNAGAGAGGTAGKGPGCVRTKGGLGTASLVLPGGIVVGALVVVNALGGLIHPVTGKLYATDGGFDVPLLYHQTDEEPEATASMSNTTLGVIATNAPLAKPQLIKVADLAHDGLARAIRPAHAMGDGDTIFAIAPHGDRVELDTTTGANLTDLVGAAAADAMVLAILDAARETEGAEGWPSVREARAAFTPSRAGPAR